MSEIASQLNADGFVPAKRAKQFSGAMVSKLMARQTTLGGKSIARKRRTNELQENEWWLSDLAAHLQMPVETMHRWRKVGWVSARKLNEASGRWALFADENELIRLRELRVYRRGWGEQKTPSRLTTPSVNSR